MHLSIIVAYDKNRVIGHAGNLPWKIPADLKFFKETTMRHTVIMGRKTHESIGRALPGRLNIVVTRQANYQTKGDCPVASSLEAAIALAKERNVSDQEAFVIGGGELYAQVLPIADKIYATEIEAEFSGDTYFPKLAAAEWQETSRVTQNDADTAGLIIHFLTYIKKK